jgi:hypothetical protein
MLFSNTPHVKVLICAFHPPIVSIKRTGNKRFSICTGILTLTIFQTTSTLLSNDIVVGYHRLESAVLETEVMNPDSTLSPICTSTFAPFLTYFNSVSVNEISTSHLELLAILNNFVPVFISCHTSTNISDTVQLIGAVIVNLEYCFNACL